MTFEKKVQPTVDVEFGKAAPKDAEPKKAASEVQVFAPYSPTRAEENADLCTVLHGYGRVAADAKHYIDNYQFVGGVCRNVPRNVAQAWAKGVRWQDEKPAVSRVYLQAILPNNATEVDFSKATGIQLMPAAKLAAMIGATDAKSLVDAMGEQAALALADALRKQIKE